MEDLTPKPNVTADRGPDVTAPLTCCDCGQPGELRQHPFAPGSLVWCDSCLQTLRSIGYEAFEKKCNELQPSDCDVVFDG